MIPGGHGGEDAASVWEGKITSGSVSFAELVTLKHWQRLSGPEFAEKAELGLRFYDRALESFKSRIREDDSEDVYIAIFAACGCGCYLAPDGRFWWTVIERAIGFDWTEAHRLLYRLDALARRTREWWPQESPDEADVARNASEARPHLTRTYDLLSSVFSAINLETELRSEQEAAGETLGQPPSDAFRSRMRVLKPNVEQAEELLNAAAQRAAQQRYAFGMTYGFAALLLLCAALGAVFAIKSTAAWYGVPILAGGLGAVVSVLRRMSTGRMRLDYNAGSDMLRIFGAVRPLIGAIFGMAVLCLIEGGLVPAIVVSSPLPFYGAVGFLAGFNERFAQDMLAGSARRLADSGASSGEPAATG
jgi:hypothetical protein